MLSLLLSGREREEPFHYVKLTIHDYLTTILITWASRCYKIEKESIKFDPNNSESIHLA